MTVFSKPVGKEMSGQQKVKFHPGTARLKKAVTSWLLPAKDRGRSAALAKRWARVRRAGMKSSLFPSLYHEKKLLLTAGMMPSLKLN